MTPIELLSSELDKWNRAKAKSIKLYKEHQISLKTYNMHMTNLNPKISIYESAIDILKFHTTE